MKFNSKWKIDRFLLYKSKTLYDMIDGVMQCNTCKEFKCGGIDSKRWVLDEC